MSVPTELVGAWRRSGLIFEGKRKVDYCDVIWLQTPEWFADIRLIIDPTATPPTEGLPSFFYKEFSFAGVTTWETPVITWDHWIDSTLSSSLDSNPLTFEDGVAFERGTAEVNGDKASFIEEWLRMTDDNVKWSADNGPGWARIEVGRFAVEVRDERSTGGPFLATRYEWDGTDWATFGSLKA